MGLDLDKFTLQSNALMEEIVAMAATLDESGHAVNDALIAGAQPIYEQMRANASSDPAIRSGVLIKNITVSKVVKHGGVKRVTIGARYGPGKANHAHLLEFGHAGPTANSRPTPAHPFLRPAFDAKKDEAFKIIREKLRNATR